LLYQGIRKDSSEIFGVKAINTSTFEKSSGVEMEKIDLNGLKRKTNAPRIT